MKNLSSDIIQRLKAARRAAGLSQTELAASLGCKQSALSMFEKGDGTKLNDEVIEGYAQRFGIALRPAAAVVEPAPPAPAPLAAPAGGFCPNPDCPSNHRYQVAGVSFAKPDRAACDPAGGRFCAVCGEVLERHCPHCGAALHEGAVCSFCGHAYVTLN